MGDLLKGLQKVQYSEVALWGLGHKENVYQVKPSVFLFFSLILISISDFNGYLLPACFIEQLLKKQPLKKIIKNYVSVGSGTFLQTRYVITFLTSKGPAVSFGH